MDSILVFIIGLVVGCVIMYLSARNSSIGTLKMHESRDGSYLFLELDDEISSIYNKKHVTLEVDINSPATHK